MSGAGLDQMRHERLDPVDHAEHVHRHDALPVLRIGQPQRPAAAAYTGIVDDHVYPAEVLQGAEGQGVNSRRVADIGDHRQHSPTADGEFLGCGLQALGAVSARTTDTLQSMSPAARARPSPCAAPVTTAT